MAKSLHSDEILDASSFPFTVFKDIDNWHFLRNARGNTVAQIDDLRTAFFISHCLNACGPFPKPEEQVPEMLACLREISEQNFVSGLAIGGRIDALLASIDGTPAGTPDPEQPTEERVRECLEACKTFDNPVEAVRDLIEGFFDGQGEPTRDETVFYMTVTDQDTKATATLIISNTSPDVAQRISDCVNACKDLKDPIVAVAFLSRLPEVLRICEDCLSKIPNKTAFQIDTLALIKTALAK